MKRHVNAHLRSTNKMVMFALLAALFISLGYLASQSKEGFKEGARPVAPPPPPPVPTTKACTGKPQLKSESMCIANGGKWEQYTK